MMQICINLAFSTIRLETHYRLKHPIDIHFDTTLPKTVTQSFLQLYTLIRISVKKKMNAKIKNAGLTLSR